MCEKLGWCFAIVDEGQADPLHCYHSRAEERTVLNPAMHKERTQHYRRPSYTATHVCMYYNDRYCSEGSTARGYMQYVTSRSYMDLDFSWDVLMVYMQCSTQRAAEVEGTVCDAPQKQTLAWDGWTSDCDPSLHPRRNFCSGSAWNTI